MDQLPVDVNENQDNNDMYVVIPEDQAKTTDPSPIEKAMELIAHTQAEQARAMAALAEGVNRPPAPVNVYTQQQQGESSDPVDQLQGEIKSLSSQLEQMRTNGDIDDSEYAIRYQNLIAPKREELLQLRFNQQMDQKLSEQKKILEQIQGNTELETRRKQEEQIIRDFPEVAIKDSPLIQEASRILSDPKFQNIFKDRETNLDQYYALVAMADSNLKARGAHNKTRTNAAVNQFGSLGNPEVYKNQGTPTSFTANDINELRNEFGQALTNDRLIRLSGFYEQAKSGSVTLSDWMVR